MKITVYSKPDCMQCNFTKKFLEDAGADFEVKDISVSEKAKNEVKELKFFSLPVVVAEGFEPFTGFRPDILQQIVSKA